MAYTRPFPVNPALTAISIGYHNPAAYYIADQVLPRQPVGGEKFEWIQYPLGQSFTVPKTEVGRRGRVTRVEFSGTPMTDQVNDYALEDAIPNSDIEEADRMRVANLGSYNPMDTATEGLTDLLLIDREIRVASLVQNPNNYDPTRRLALAGAGQFSNPDSDPIGVIKQVLAATLVFRPNIMVLGRLGFDSMSSHPKLVNAIRGNVTGQGIVTPEEIAKLFSLDKVLMGQAYANAARPGQPVALNQIWGNYISFLYINPVVRPTNGMTWGMTATYGDRIAGNWYDKDIGIEGGQVIRVGERVKEFITAPDLGFLIQNPFAFSQPVASS